MSTATLSVAGALPVRPVTLIEENTAAPASGICTSVVLSKYLPVGGGVAPLTASYASARPSPKNELFAVVPEQRLSPLGQARSSACLASSARRSAGVALVFTDAS